MRQEFLSFFLSFSLILPPSSLPPFFLSLSLSFPLSFFLQCFQLHVLNNPLYISLLFPPQQFATFKISVSNHQNYFHPQVQTESDTGLYSSVQHYGRS